MDVNDVRSPSMSLLVKLGSIAVHTEEMMSPEGHHFDKIVLESLLKDQEVKEWIGNMNQLALLPVKRKVQPAQLPNNKRRKKS